MDLRNLFQITHAAIDMGMVYVHKIKGILFYVFFLSFIHFCFPCSVIRSVKNEKEKGKKE